jgi:TolB protein
MRHRRNPAPLGKEAQIVTAIDSTICGLFGAGRRGLRTVRGAAVALMLLVPAAPAGAAFPGENGRIAYHLASGSHALDIFTIKANGTHRHRLTRSPADEREPAYSPDGRKLAFMRKFDIWTMNPDGSHKQALTHDGTGRVDESPSFSPSGNKIVWSRDGHLRIANSDGSDAHNVGYDGRMPAWSPNGRWIACVHAFSAVNGIVKLHPDGSDVTDLTADQPTLSTEQPDWSPDGHELAYWGHPPDYGGDVWLMRADGADKHTLVSDADDEGDPAYSPDGEHVAFVHYFASGPKASILTVPAGGGIAAPVVVGDVVALSPSWQPR